ncbi:hypothetical protein [Streptomyces sp. CB03911]|uniref:hypothetical protein n=1 Tax=Streptomyces sp. CB03911 TaxID=1804758 RepID=UPI0018FEE7E8|nr:hypothetical protein [Streptomyces sp. CB03911]
MSLRFDAEMERLRQVEADTRRLQADLTEARARAERQEARADREAARANAILAELKAHTSSTGRRVTYAWPTGPVSVDEFHAALYAENESGGEARGVVADVARVLGVDIDAGPGHRWDLDHMSRVVEAARALTDAGPLKATIVRQALRITELEKESSK